MKNWSIKKKVLDIMQESYEEEFESSVEFDLLSDDIDNQDENSISGYVYPYSDLKAP